MHRLIIAAPRGMQVDHIDGNGLNNTRLNLRLADHSRNQMNRPAGKNNSAGYKGVSYHKAAGKFLSQIGHNGKNIYLGLHDTPEAAHAAYVAAALELHGEFACTNTER
jgi:hypothetical protein